VAQNDIAVSDAAKRDFADDKRMQKHFVAVEQGSELWIGGAQVIDPGRGIDQDHAGLAGPAARRRLGFRVAAAEAREPARALALDQRLERFAHQCGLFADAGEGFSFGEEIVIEGERGTREAWNMASDDAGDNALLCLRVWPAWVHAQRGSNGNPLSDFESLT